MYGLLLAHQVEVDVSHEEILYRTGKKLEKFTVFGTGLVEFKPVKKPKRSLTRFVSTKFIGGLSIDTHIISLLPSR